jgi:hypothetical protein
MFSNKEYKIKKILSVEQMKKLFPTFINWKLYVAANATLIKTVNYITEPAEIEFASKDIALIEKDCKKLSAIEEKNIESIFIPI